MVNLAIYDVDDLGLFPRTRLEAGFSEPVLKNFTIRQLDVRKVPRRNRIQVIRDYIDKTDFISFGVGSYTFMRPWARFALMYGFSKNRPMYSANSAYVPDGWSHEITRGPNPASRIKWEVHGPDIRLYSLDTVFEVVWQFKRSVPRSSVHYRLTGETGTLEDICPMHDWVYDNVEQNVFDWIKRSMWLAGL
jgi:hypothetical protein